MAPQDWALDEDDGLYGSSYLFVEADACVLKAVGLGTSLLQGFCMLFLYFALDDADISLTSSESTSWLNSTPALWLAGSAFVVFLVSWLVKDFMQGFKSVKRGYNPGKPCDEQTWSVICGLAQLAVTGCGAASSMMYAYGEATGDGGGAHKIILESVTVLLILELDDKVFEAMLAIYGKEKLMNMIGGNNSKEKSVSV